MDKITGDKWPIEKRSINAFMDFVLGFPYDFIEQAWKDRPDLVLHFRRKITEYAKSEAPPISLIPWFWTTLSTDNREILISFIINWYEGD